jgi:hypothetical protein
MPSVPDRDCKELEELFPDSLRFEVLSLPEPERSELSDITLSCYCKQRVSGVYLWIPGKTGAFPSAR